jgi:hypothetical protein
MKTQYQAAFIVPVPSRKELDDSGWCIHSEKRLPESIISFLTGSLDMKPVESKAGISWYESPGLKAAVLRDDSGSIEHVYLQAHGKSLERVLSAFEGSAISRDAEVFVPDATA